jgi:hypothetical protein
MILCQVDISSALFESSTIDPATPRHRAMDRLQHYFCLTEANSVVLAFIAWHAPPFFTEIKR